MDEIWESLQSHRVQIVQQLRVDRSLLFDHLRSKEVFDSEDCELVNAEKTKERKASKLLDILKTKDSDGLVHFLDVLQLLNPGLYEVLTGQKATTRENPIINEVSGMSVLTDLDPQRDMDILGNHLRRAVGDLQEMTLRYDQLLKENQQQSKVLCKVTADRELDFKRLQTMEDQLRKTVERAEEAQNTAQKFEEDASVQRKEFENAMGGWFLGLVAVLMKLVTSEEEAKQLKKKLEEERKRNEELMHYNEKERRHSLILAEEIALQRSSLDRTKKLKISLHKVQMEKDQAEAEFSELKEWSEALKACFDIEKKNKKELQKRYDNLLANCSQLRKQIRELKFELANSQQQELNVKAQNDELTGFVNKYKEQCDFHGKEMIKAINEKFEARSERELIYQQLREALKEKDETLKRLVMETKEYNLRQEMAIAETQRLKERLTRTEEELMSLKRKTSVKYKSSLPLHTGSNDDDDDAEADDDDDSGECTQLIKSIKAAYFRVPESLPARPFWDGSRDHLICAIVVTFTMPNPQPSALSTWRQHLSCFQPVRV
ncbi:uncharacterized protein [Porites lutea]|uniref:uncharacterized protein isoform X2 n=1 Tax=Porites lutea TaxID=51062 RepID=UPI003CC5FAB2